MAQQYQYLIDAASAALEARKGTHATDPGPGYWNNRADFRTDQPAIGDSNIASVEAPHGIGYARSRAVPTGSCPSGPCGCREEVATWYVAKALDLPEYYRRLEEGAPLTGAEIIALGDVESERQGPAGNWIFTEGFRE